MTPPRLLSLDEAARMIAPGGRITARSLRTEISKGRLAAVRIPEKQGESEDGPMLWEQGVASSNPAAPTIEINDLAEFRNRPAQKWRRNGRVSQVRSTADEG